jgi:hypothetical protein
MVNPALRVGHRLMRKARQFTAFWPKPWQIPQMTCQFPFKGLRKKVLTVKGSRLCRVRASGYVRQDWLLEEDDRSKAGGGFGTAPALLL